MKWKKSNSRVRAASHALTMYALAALALLVFCLVRMPALEALPLHNDEGLHLTRAVEVWNLHPFWEIRDGKIVNHFLIAALIPQADPIWAGRLPTILVGMVGLAAGFALAWRIGGQTAAVLASLLWIASPYLFFYERMAFSDAQAGALVAAAVYAALRAVEGGSLRWCMIAGAALTSAALFKVTALPFALPVVLILLLHGQLNLSRRLLFVGMVGALLVAGFSVPLFVLLRRGDGLFDIALGWIGTSAPGGGFLSGVGGNLGRLGALLFGFGTPVWAAALLIGVVVLAFSRHRWAWWLIAAFGLPLAIMVLLGREALSRHFVVVAPLAVVAAACGWAWLWETMHRRRGWQGGVTLLGWLLLAAFIPFAQTAYRSPAALSLPDLMRTQYITEHSAGFGLREAMEDLPRQADAGVPIIGSLFPDSCRRANFYAHPDFRLTCGDAPNTAALFAALDSIGIAYVLTDTAPLIGADVPALAAEQSVTAERVAAYPRPGENADAASVVLWRVYR
jgi:hypothetical protein